MTDYGDPTDWTHPVDPDGDDVRALFDRVLELVQQGQPAAARLELAYRLSNSRRAGFQEGAEETTARKAIANSMMSEHVASPSEGFMGTLTAWLDAAAFGTSADEALRLARVGVEFAGRIAWLAEMKDPVAALRFALEECERSEDAYHGLDLDDHVNEIADDVTRSIEGTAIVTSLQQLVDMGCQSIAVEPPAVDSDTPHWIARVVTHCGCRLTRATAESNVDAVLRLAAETVGEHLQGERKGMLDS